MKHLATSALALAFASGAAFAETHTMNEEGVLVDDQEVVESEEILEEDALAMEGREYTSDDLYTEGASLIRTGDITGGDIYSMGEEYAGLEAEAGWQEQEYTEIGEDWNDIGEIEDIVLSRDGQMIGIVAEVGGFLDIGDKQVLIPINDVSLVPVDERSYAYVTRMTEEQLSQLEGIDEGFWN